MRPTRVLRSAIVLKTSTLLYLHNLLKKRKYCLLFRTKSPRPSAVGDSRMLVIFFGSVALQLERTSSQAHLGSRHESGKKAKTAFNPQVNKIQSHSFK